MKYRRKNPKVEAIQFTGEVIEGVTSENEEYRPYVIGHYNWHLRPGDYVVLDKEGPRPVSQEYFERNYESAD